MSEKPPSPKGGCSGRSLGIVLFLVFIFVLLPGFGNTSLGEILFHLLAGSILHAKRNLPNLSDQWSGLIPPLCCLVIAFCMFHRFVVWWLHEKAPEVNWKQRHSWFALGILLGICAAAIAMSGITHQSAWLAGESWLETRGMKGIRASAVTNAKILGLALFEYHNSHGRYPATLDELEETCESVQRFTRMPAMRNGPPEPFLFLKPGATESAGSNEILLISPYIPESNCWVVSFGDHSVRPIKETELNELLTKRKP